MIDVVDEELGALVDARAPIEPDLLDAVPWTRPPVGWATQGHRFAYRTVDEVLDRELDRMFGDLRPLTPREIADPGTELLSAVAYPGPQGMVWGLVNGTDVVRTRQRRWHIAATMMWMCNQGVIATTHRDSLSVHAGVVARDGRAVVMAAPQEAGKTTLTTGLLRRGLDYLSDEAAVIDRTTLRVGAYPKPLSIDRGSWPLFPELEPDGEQTQFSQDQWLVRAGTVGSGRVVGDAMPAVVLLPQYRRGGETALRPIGPAMMVRELARSTFHYSVDPVANLRAAAALVERCRYHRLDVGDLETACDLVLDLLETTA